MVADLQHHYLVASQQPAVDRIGQGEPVHHRPEYPLVVHRGDQSLLPGRFGGLGPRLGHPRRGCQIQPAIRQDRRVVVDRGPRLAPCPRGAVRLIDDHQVPPAKAANVGLHEHRQRRVGGKDRGLPSLPDPSQHLAPVGRAGHLRSFQLRVPAQRADRHHGPGAACTTPRGHCLHQQVQRGQQDQNPARAGDTLSDRRAHEGLARPARRNDRRPQPRPNCALGRNSPQRADRRVHSLNLMRPQRPTACHRQLSRRVRERTVRPPSSHLVRR